MRKPAGWAGMIGALLCLAAAALTMVSMFQDLVVVQTVSGPENVTFRITLWDVQIVSDGATQAALESGGPSAPQNAVPLMFAVAMLIAAAMLGMFDRARRLSRAGGLAAVIAATFLTAAVAVVITQALWWMDVLEPGPILPREGVDVTTTVDAGLAVWALVAGVALAITAAVLIWRQPGAEPERTEPETPRIGIPVVRRLPDEPSAAED